MNLSRIEPSVPPQLTAVINQRFGRFVTFEGIDGCGKSSQVGLLATSLQRLGATVVLAREPGGTPLGESIRRLLLDAGSKGMRPTTELALMFASRAQLVAQVIEPALLRGDWVLCDRFVDSSEAYQGGGRGLGSETVLTLHRALLGGITPDLTILLNHDVDGSIARARARRAAEQGKQDRFESESRCFFERVQDTFAQIASREQERVFVTNANRPLEDVRRDILAEVLRRFFSGR